MENNDTIVNYSPPLTTAELVVSELRGGGENIRASVEQEKEHVMENLREIKWTDKKHSLYLESMEASFVNQLNDSIDLLGWSCHKHVSKTNSSGQFKVFREGWRGRMNCRREEVELNKGDVFEQITSNPWVRRYRSECRQHTRRPASLEKDLHTKDEFRASSFYVRHRAKDRGSSDQFLEATDQNFLDEGTKGEKECELQNSKRIKTEAFSNED